MLDGFRRIEAAHLQVGQGVRRLLHGLVVVSDDLVEQGLVVGVAEADAVLLDDPVYRATGSTAAEAVPQVLRGGHHQAGGVVFMERALAG